MTIFFNTKSKMPWSSHQYETLALNFKYQGITALEWSGTARLSFFAGRVEDLALAQTQGRLETLEKSSCPEDFFNGLFWKSKSSMGHYTNLLFELLTAANCVLIKSSKLRMSSLTMHDYL